MTFAVHGLAVARGIAIGRAVLVASSRVDVAHYFIEPDQVRSEIVRVRNGRNAVVEELQRLQAEMPADAPPELAALLDVHLMLLQDEALVSGVKHWITDRLYNAEWALTTQAEIIARQFDEMEDEYLRERKADLEQVVERILRHMKGVASPVAPPPCSPRRGSAALGLQQDLLPGDMVDVPLVLVAHDLSPADMLQFKQSVFAGFVTDVGGKTSHTAIVARSMDIPAVVGACREPPGAAGRLGDHRRGRGDHDRRSVADHPGRIRLPPAPDRTGARAAVPPAAHAGRDARRRAHRASGEHRAARRCRGGRACGRCGRGAVPQRIHVHGPGRPPSGRGRAVPGLPRRGGGHAGPARHPANHRRGRGQAAGSQGCEGSRQPPQSGAGPAGHPLEPGRSVDVPHAPAGGAARGRARAGEPAVPDAGPCRGDPADAGAGGHGARGTGGAWRALRAGAGWGR